MTGIHRTTSPTKARRLMRGRKAYVLVSGAELWVPTTQKAVLGLIEHPITVAANPDLNFHGRGLEIDLNHAGRAYVDWYDRRYASETPEGGE